MKKGFDIVSIIFWIAIVFYLDPGGFVAALSENDIDATRTIVFKFGLLAISYILLIFKYNSRENSMIKSDFINWYTYIMFIWLLYYLFWFYGLNNPTYPGPLKLIMRNQRMIGQILLVYPIAYFASINLANFIKITTWTTIIIMIMYLLTVFLNIPLVELVIFQRGFEYDLTRYFMMGFGIMHLSLPIAIALLMMKFKGEKLIVIAGVMIVILIVIMINRRDMVGIIELIIIMAFFVNHIHGKKPLQFIWRFINMKSILYTILLLIVIGLVFPNLYLVAMDVFENSYRTIILGEASGGRAEDVRMSLTAQYGIVNAIEENLFFGTGNDPSWSSGDGGVKGFEGSDYVFLASFGMYGLIGLLIFIPFYIITVMLIIRFIKLLKSNRDMIYRNKNIFIYPVIIGLATSAEFIKNIIEYPNWFYPIGAIKDSPKYFIYFGLLLGSYYQLFKLINYYKKRQYSE